MNTEELLSLTLIFSFVAMTIALFSFVASPLFKRIWPRVHQVSVSRTAGETSADNQDEVAKQLETERTKWELKEQGYQQVIRESNVDIQALIDQVRELGGEPVRKLNGRQAKAANGELPIVELYNLMEQCFDGDDLDDILLQLNIDPGAISGDTLPGRMRNLIRYCQRRGRLAHLVSVCRGERPRITWPDVN